MFCDNCGTDNSENARFCKACGAELINQQPKKKNVKQMKKRKKKNIALFLVILCVFLSIGIYIYKNWSTPKLTATEKLILELHEMKEELDYDNALDELSELSVNMADDVIYHRLQQNYCGVPVHGKSIVCVTDIENNIQALFGNIEDIDETIEMKPSITDNEIDRIIAEYIKNELKIEQVEAIEISEIDDNKLVVYTNERDDVTCLAYHVSVSFYENFYECHELIINAITGEIMNAGGMLFNERVTGYKASDNNREHGFTVEKYNDNLYRLEDKEKNIIVRNFNGNASSTKDENDQEINHFTDGFSSFVDSEDEIFGNSEKERTLDYEDAATLMLNATKMYQYFAKELCLKKQSKSDSFVFFYNDGYDNGNNARGGRDSNGNGIISMGSVVGVEDIDVMAHEYTHLVSRYLVNFNTYKMIENNAINEALSDIFGELIEAYIKSDYNNPDWIMMIDNRNSFRNMIEPKATNNKAKLDKLPNEREMSSKDIIKKGYEYSTLLSHAAYLMWNGIDGNIDKKIPSEKLGKLWYHTMLLLPSDCDFKDCRKAVEMAATSLKLTAEQMNCIGEAFNQVGISGLEDDSTLCVYVLKGDAKILVYSGSGKLYDNYTLYIKGSRWSKPEDDEQHVIGDRTTVEMTEVISTTDAYQLDLSEGEYHIEITDNLNPSEKKFCDIIVDPENGQSSLYINTNFGGIPIRGSISEKRIENGKEINVPIQNAKVTIYSQDKTDVSTVDMEDGKDIFEFFYPNGQYHIVVEADDYETKTISFEVENEEIFLPIILESNDTMFYEYIKNNLKLSKNFPFPELIGDEIGVFSAYINDFDGDGVKEMITGSIKHNEARQEYMVLDLYTKQNGMVEHMDSSEEIFATGVGNFQNITCCTYEEGLIKIYSEVINYGGSGTTDAYVSYSVENDKFVVQNNFSSYSRPVYEAYEYVDYANNISYSDYEEYNQALLNEGFDTRGHLHIGYRDSEFNVDTDDYKTSECFKGNHVFTLVSSANYLTSGLYGFIYDNTNMLEKLYE